jgi:hypothetical protein
MELYSSPNHDDCHPSTIETKLHSPPNHEETEELDNVVIELVETTQDSEPAEMYEENQNTGKLPIELSDDAPNVLASSPPTKSQSVVNDSDGEHKHKKKEVSRSEHGESCPMYFEIGELHGGNEQKQSSVDGWCCDERKSRSNSNCTSSNYTRSGFDDNENTHDAENDWEVAFDALHIQSANSDQIQHNELKYSHERKPNGVHHLDLQIAMLKP